jgi:hypothetical protein
MGKSGNKLREWEMENREWIKRDENRERVKGE